MSFDTPSKPDDRLLKDTQSFIIRIWHEGVDKDTKTSIWRGSIDQVGGDLRLYFDSLDSIGRFIQEQTGIKLKQTHSWWQSVFYKFRHGHSRN